MAAATSGDKSLAGFIQAFHPKWDGFLQLRIFLGAADEQTYSLHYPSLSIHVVGDTWTAVGGGPVNCASGTAESLESIVLPSTTTTTPQAPAGSAAGQKGSSGGTGSGSQTGSAKGAAQSAKNGSTSGIDAQSSAALAPHDPSNAGLLAGIVLGAIFVLAGTALLLLRRRSQARTGPSVTKGH